jgi:hypothetical protein
LIPDFIFPVYDDFRLVTRLISQLRGLYPTACLVCVSDGNFSQPDFIEVCDRYSVRLIQTNLRLKLPHFGGMWLERLFEAALIHTSSLYIIRTEGDTSFWRKFSNYPTADLGGTVNERYGFRFAVGGCVFMRRTAVMQILESGVLWDSRYCSNLVYSYPRYAEFRYANEALDERQVLLSDLILGNVAHRLGLEIASWAEVDIRFRGIPRKGFAATHPHR